VLFRSAGLPDGPSILENRAAADARTLVPAFLAASDEAWLLRHRAALNGTAPSNLQDRP